MRIYDCVFRGRYTRKTSNDFPLGYPSLMLVRSSVMKNAISHHVKPLRWKGKRIVHTEKQATERMKPGDVTKRREALHAELTELSSEYIHLPLRQGVTLHARRPVAMRVTDV